MRAAELSTIRILFWNMTDISGHDWGVLPSANGKLVEPYRSNLIRFATDVRNAGFSVFTVDFSPQWTNNPIGEYGPNGLTNDRWDPAKFDENWGLVADTHQLVKRFGPPTTHFDFMSEGPPSHYQPSFIVERMQSYVADMWRRYAAGFGTADASVSVIAKGSPADGADRLQHLIDAVRSTGLPFPDYFTVHPDWTSPTVYDELRAFDDTLRANGLLDQPIVVGESSYENPAVASDIARFMRDTGRGVSEVYEFWQTAEGGSCASAPYRGDAYITTLTGAPTPKATPTPLPLIPIPTLSALVTRSGKATLRSAAGRAVSQLDAGTYRIVLRDQSTKAGFRLSGLGLSVTTGKAFIGTRAWTGDIGSSAPYGARITYGSTARPHTRTAVTVH